MWHSGFQLNLGRLRRFVSAAKRAAGVHGEVGVRLMDDAAIRELNRKFRRKDAATDVLSFANGGQGGYLGDVAVSLDMAARQAGARRHGLEAEVSILLLHGLLHLAGYDHESDQGEMERQERALRGRLGLPTGLIERGSRGKIGGRGRGGRRA